MYLDHIEKHAIIEHYNASATINSSRRLRQIAVL